MSRHTSSRLMIAALLLAPGWTQHAWSQATESEEQPVQVETPAAVVPEHEPEPASGPLTGASPKPQRFRDLFEVGGTVFLGTSPENPLYAIRLLTDEQTKQVEELAVKQAETEDRLNHIEKLLEGERSLPRLAALLKEQQDLVDAVASQPMRGESPYVVTHVGEDFVAVSRGKTERFVPFGSIRSVYRSENLKAADTDALRRSRAFGLAGESSVRRGLMVRLHHAQAGELVNVLKELYAGVDLKMTADSRNNMLELEAPGATGNSITRLIEAIDARLSAVGPVDVPPAE